MGEESFEIPGLAGEQKSLWSEEDMRLKKKEIQTIENAIHSFDPDATIYLFGSRTDDMQRGGDIDLLVFSKCLTYGDKLKIKQQLLENLEEQKIDLVLAKDTSDPFVRLVLGERSSTRMNTMKDALKQELSSLERARDILRYSYEKCGHIEIKDDLDYEELESFEALTSRFARLSDSIIQKILRLFEALDLEKRGTVRDRINRAEKRGIIESADDFIQIRILRNEIAHEYKSETVSEMFKHVMKRTPVLLKSVDSIVEYSERYFKE